MQQLAEEGDRRARSAMVQMDQVDAYVATSQVGITLASIGLGFAGKPAIADLIEPALKGAVSEGVAIALSFGFAYAVENTDRVHLVGVDGGDGCTPATEDTIAAAGYPIARYLYIYPNLATAADESAVEAFVDFYISDEGIANVSTAGYVQLAPSDLEATRAAWEDR